MYDIYKKTVVIFLHQKITTAVFSRDISTMVHKNIGFAHTKNDSIRNIPKAGLPTHIL